VGALNSATDSFIKSWYSIAGNTVVNVANGTTVTVETLLVTIARVRLVPIAQTNAQLSMQINDCILPNGITMPTTQGSSVATIVGCELPAGRINANVGLRNSKLAAPVFVGLANVGTPVLAGCLLTGAAIITLTAVNWNVGNAFDGGSCVVQSGRVDFSSLCEFSNGAGLTAVNLQQISQSAWTGGAAFGFGTPYAIGWSLESGCLVVASSVANASIPSTQNLSMTGHNLAYAAAPLTYPRAACTFAITPDPAAVAVSV
jgi:hypothetical protein